MLALIAEEEKSHAYKKVSPVALTRHGSRDMTALSGLKWTMILFTCEDYEGPRQYLFLLVND